MEDISNHFNNKVIGSLGLFILLHRQRTNLASLAIPLVLIIYSGKLLGLSFESSGDGLRNSPRMKLEPGASEKAVLRPFHWCGGDLGSSSSILIGATHLWIGGNSGFGKEDINRFSFLDSLRG